MIAGNFQTIALPGDKSSQYIELFAGRLKHTATEDAGKMNAEAKLCGFFNNEGKSLRIGTWNLNGAWTDAHRELLESQECDVWLLTEVNMRLNLAGYYPPHFTKELMGKNKHWAAIVSRRPLDASDDPHPTSAMAKINGLTYCSSVLPWSGWGNIFPGLANDQEQKAQSMIRTVRRLSRSECTRGIIPDWMAAALATLLGTLPRTKLVWGGDWNETFFDPNVSGVGSAGGRCFLKAAIHELNLRVPTEHLRHRLGYCSIDHIAVPTKWGVTAAWSVNALKNDGELSDHDAYVVHLIPTLE